MSSNTPEKHTAEQRFREAFARLKSGTPLILPKGSIVSQNNVAREAGCDPSALKKSRYPELIIEIQNYALENTSAPPISQRKIDAKRREQTRSLRNDIDLLKAERDVALSLLVEADNKIFDLTMENQRLKAHMPRSTVTPIRPQQS